MKKMIFSAGLALGAFTCSNKVTAQKIDSLPAGKDSVHMATIEAPVSKRTTGIHLTTAKAAPYHPSIAGIAIPAAMIGYGFIALNNPSLRDLNHSTSAEIKEDHPGFSAHIDNYLQYSPVAAVYILNAAGVHGKHNLVDRTIILGISAVLTAGSVEAVKNWSHEQRPDGSDYLSFPSGHTATAFASAEFMRQEYKDVSIWYGVGGYAAAVATGALRMYNNKHWLSDVVAGAGFGILSTKAAYWMYPWVQRKVVNKIFKEKSNSGTSMIMPYYNSQFRSAGLSLVFFPK
ncbi:membrane-associated phospholipid phosphatase [Chitinophaga niastensis]|uniref:Membrane-associated phospholipid phosphatase n=1 Tax=Chitinophaga niastensis TaxID=536980 RepID=A0A2P8HB55_CHINA|nr:phosphatase PAP2 family protein [Chitinophaga niastensis]PSL43391.1 membrane-associated phospholipid phosphatase [Chitinophaga niastensis]